MKENRNFLTAHKEFELLSEYPACSSFVNEYIRNDIDRSNASFGTYPVVYDCLDPSPFYEGEEDLYIDEKDAIELSPL
jgi:hypothetical protein